MRLNNPLVIAGLDPAIHDEDRRVLAFRMDHRVKPGDDEVKSTMNVFRQITPLRIGIVNQSDFPSSRPVLDIFLTLNRKRHRRVPLEMNKRLHVISHSEIAQAFLMFMYPFRNVIRHADIKCATWFACKYVKPSTLHQVSMDCRVKPGNDEII